MYFFITSAGGDCPGALAARMVYVADRELPAGGDCLGGDARDWVRLGERERSVVGEGGRRERWGGVGDYFLFLKGETHIFKNYSTK